MTPAIRVENLSKQFRIGARQDGYMTLRESLSHAAAAPWRRLRRVLRKGTGSGRHSAELPGKADPYGACPLSQHNRKGTGSGGNSADLGMKADSNGACPLSQDNGHAEANTIWALKDVSFEVQPGEVVGIIGRNGAGKSTLLKILSRITEPTSGRVALHGRVASLLEVGTGFHPELTGRENIYLNGAILGMTRREINRKFDEIVDFAEIDQFIDTPVKRYSSGMYVRLAFSVAAHLEPEMLIVDEVLAVGDAAFQKKCLGKMQDVSSVGRTVLFVSHNTAAIQGLCSSTIVLNRGCMTFIGPSEAGVAVYLNSLQQEVNRATDSAGIFNSVLRQIILSTGNGRPTNRFMSGDPMMITLSTLPHRLPRLVNFQLTFYTDTGAPLFVVATHLSECGPVNLNGSTEVICRLHELALAPGQYVIAVTIGAPYSPPAEHIMPAVTFEVTPGDFYGNSSKPHTSLGYCLVRSAWSKSSER